MDGYQKKKYVCKLLFIFLLGHDIDFGQMEAVNLLSSNKYTEKQIVSIDSKIILATSKGFVSHKMISFQGYLFISVLISGNSELIQLIVQSIKNDLASRFQPASKTFCYNNLPIFRNPVHVSLALQCIANIGSKDMAEAFGGDIPKLLVSGWALSFF